MHHETVVINTKSLAVSIKAHSPEFVTSAWHMTTKVLYIMLHFWYFPPFNLILLCKLCGITGEKVDLHQIKGNYLCQLSV